MKHLYIIGNGFDLHHRMKTSYKDFHKYLIDKNKTDIIAAIEEYYHVTNNFDFWNEFERNLQDFDPEELIDSFENGDFEPKYGSDDFRDADYYDYEIFIENKVEPLVSSLPKALKEWIKHVNKRNFLQNIIARVFKYNVEKNAFFLTFNYTNTLEKIYHIRQSNILHIHGSISDKELVIGHSYDPDKWYDENLNDKKEINKENMTEEEYNWKIEELANNYSFSRERGIIKIDDTFRQLYKNASDIIEKNESFFTRLSDIKNITIIGHSMSDVDRKYFEVICKDIDTNKVKWDVYYHDNCDKERFRKFLLCLNIKDDNIIFIKS